MLPSDPMILLCFVNTKLRDECSSLEEFCDRYDADLEKLTADLAAVGYTYLPEQNTFH